MAEKKNQGKVIEKPHPMVHINADITTDQKEAVDKLRDRIGIAQSQQIRFGLTMYLETMKEHWEEED